MAAIFRILPLFTARETSAEREAMPKTMAITIYLIKRPKEE
jgi:hypothetical protein